ncbi:MAG: AMP-binding protein [Pseudomonadota bacterium]
MTAWKQWYRGDEDAYEGRCKNSIEEILAEAEADPGERPLITTLLPGGIAGQVSGVEFARQSRRFGSYLRSTLGLASGEVIAIQAPNCLGYAICAVGALRAGLVVSNINPLYTPTETRTQLKDCGAETLVFCDLFANQVMEACKGTPVKRWIAISVTEGFSWPKRTLVRLILRAKRELPKPISAAVSLTHIVQSASGELPEEPSVLDTAMLYQYSGGTTGRSKGVVITRGNLFSNLSQGTSLCPEVVAKRGRTSLLVMPMYHMFGLYMCLATMMTGGHLVLVPNPRPLSILKVAFDRYKPDVFPGVNTLFLKLMEEPWFQANPPALEFTPTGATALDPEVGERWEQLTGSFPVCNYGLTEATTLLTSNPADGRHRKGSVGIPLPGTTVSILDVDGSEMPTDQPGEIVARGPQVAAGYLNRPDADSDTFALQGLRTGDIGYLDKDGYLYIVDRKKDVILVSGFNVYPIEVETALNEHPGVLESGVVGHPSRDSGEKVVAYVVLRTSAVAFDELDAWCRERLAAYKCPKEFHRLDELPKTPIGKVQRRALRS